MYYKHVENGYISGIGFCTDTVQDSISQAEYNEILTVIRSCPTSPDGKGYRLKTDLTWEAYDLPPEPEPSDEDEIPTDEALNILLGGAQ